MATGQRSLSSFGSWTIRRKMVASFLALALITLALGAGSIMTLNGIKSEIDTLSDHHLRDWRTANAIESGIRQAGYFIVAYSLNYDPAWWDRAQTPLQTVRQHLQDGKAYAAAAGQRDFAVALERIESSLADYGRAAEQTRTVAENLVAARGRGEAASKEFVSGITPYIEFQKSSMIRQIEAKDSEAELKIRQERIAAGQRVLDLGQTAIAAAWRADAMQDVSAMKALGGTVERVRTELLALIAATRQEVNLRLLKSAATATEAFRAAILDVAKANETAAVVAKDRLAAEAAILGLAASLARGAEGKTQSSTATIVADADSSSRLAILGSVACFLLSLALGLLVSRSLARPIVDMTSTMGRLSDGELDVAVPATERHDEIGRMARAVEIFKEKLIRNRDLEAQQAALEARAKEERTAAMNSLADSFEGSVRTIVESVGSAASQVQATAGDVAAVADQANTRATAVAAASEQASSNVQTVAAAADELASSIAEIGRQVTRSTTIARSAVTETANTREAVLALVSAAGRIGDVLHVISDIAGQTNLLALNATIEAARAGEAGKGFAVVASEVKHLAGQTAQATDQITSQISGIEDATRNAVKAIDSIAATIGEVDTIAATIAAAIEEQGAATSEIARNVEQAATGTRDVSTNIAGVSKAAEKAGLASRQMLEAAKMLAQEAQTLRQGVDAFVANVRSG